MSPVASDWDPELRQDDDIFERNSLFQEEFEYPRADDYGLYFNKGRGHSEFFY